MAGPAYGFDDLRWLFESLPASLEIDLILLAHPGYSPSLERLQVRPPDIDAPPPEAEEAPALLGKFKLYWQMRQRIRVAELQSEAVSQTRRLRDLENAVAEEKEAFKQLLRSLHPSKIWYFETFSKGRKAERSARAIWRDAAAPIVATTEGQRTSTALEAVAPTFANSLSASHYSPLGAQRAADQMASVLMASPEFAEIICP